MEMPARGEAPELATVSDPRQAGLLLHPLRARLLALAREPASSSDLARRLGLPRQRVNYHVRALEAAGFLKPAGRQRKRNMIEQRYVATARAFVLSPNVLGPVGADWRDIGDPASAEYLLALTEQVREDLVLVREDARTEGEAVSTVSLKSQFRFESAGQRAEFSREIREAIVGVIARHTNPNRLDNGQPGRGQPFRLVLACYPAPSEAGDRAAGARAR
jgi:DNA-binding transcriptional ArsR family regulator